MKNPEQANRETGSRQVVGRGLAEEELEQGLLMGMGPPQERMFAWGVEWDHSGLPTVGLAKRAPLSLSASLVCQEPLDGLLMARTFLDYHWEQPVSPSPVGVACVRHRGPRAREAG